MRSLPLCLSLLLLLHAHAAWGAEIKQVQTFYYNGNLNSAPWTTSSLAVDSDGTVAVAITRSIGAFNARSGETNSSQVLLFDRSGEPIGEISARVSGMVDVAFGPDGRVYTVESWFATGSHVYERPGAKARYVPVRNFNADGSNVDRGGPESVAVGPDYKIYTLFPGKKVCVTSPDNKLLQTLPAPPGGYGKLDMTPDGTLYCGSAMLLADGTWKTMPYTVRYVRADGKLLVSMAGKYGIYDPKTERLESTLTLPAGDWADMALGPDGNVYLAPRSSADLAYVVADAQGTILLRRGADFDRLAVTLAADKFTAGATVPLTAQLTRSRELGYVAKAVQLPADNHPALALHAYLAPDIHDPLAEPTWQAVAVTRGEGEKYSLAMPANLDGRYLLKFTATETIPGLKFLEATAPVTIHPAEMRAFLTPATDRGRTGFSESAWLRLTVAVEAVADTDLSAVKLALLQDGKTVWTAPLGLDKVKAGGHPTAVLRVNSVLAPGVYTAQCIDLPAGVGSGKAIVAFSSPEKTSDFATVYHSLGGVNHLDAPLLQEMGASHISNYQFINGPSGLDSLETYLDAATRLGQTFYLQPASHFMALNSLPQEQGAMRQWFAQSAQRLQAYPSFRGFNYHDLFAPFGTWWDEVRKDKYPALWDAWGAKMEVPDSVPADKRATFTRNLGESQALPNIYAAWAEAIKAVNPDLQCTTMQWWHSNLTQADPDKVAEHQDFIATQHMEEQYYHPITVANQVDLWRVAGKPLFCYGNTSWQDDGTGQEMYRELMAGLMRGVQGIGRNEVPEPGNTRSELVFRAITPAFRMLQRYGGLSANSTPDDQVAIWRSLTQEAMENDSWHLYRRHQMNTTAAYAACLYAHRTAAIITDGKILNGDLKQYKALIISCLIAPSPTLQAKLKEFIAGGGIILANKPVDGYWAPAGAIELGPLFRDSHASTEFNRDLLRWVDMDAVEGHELADKIRAALGNHVKPLADCDDPSTWISVLKAGDAHYVFTTNLKLLPQRPLDLHRYAGYENTSMPTKTTLRLQPGKYVVYDVFAGKQVKPVVKDGAWEVTADMSVFPGSILALLPRTIDHLAVTTTTQPGDKSWFLFGIKTVDAKGSVIKAAVPLEITITDARGVQRYHYFRTTSSVEGMSCESVNIASNDQPGRWTISVRELLSGITFSGTISTRTRITPISKSITDVDVFDGNYDAVDYALRQAKTVALVTTDAQQASCQAAIAAVQAKLIEIGTHVTLLNAKDYLADRTALGWDKFRMGTYVPDIKLRVKKYDLIVTLDTPEHPNGLFPPNILRMVPTATAPGPGRGLAQVVVMPVYDTENALSLAGSDDAGLLAAIQSLSYIPVAPYDEPAYAQKYLPLPGRRTVQPPPGLHAFLGVPAAELAVSKDGQRIAVGLKGWGNNLFVLDGAGQVKAKNVGGKFFPLRVQALEGGFSVLEHENDPTTLYTKLYTQDGAPARRLAAAGRRVCGARDYSASHPEVMPERFLPQASFSITPDGRYAAVGGSKAIAVWDMQAGAVRWRDDSIHYNPEQINASGFPQVCLSPDGKALVLQCSGKILLRDGATGALTGQVTLPVGSTMGRVQLFDGHLLVIGDSEFFAYRDGAPQWHWKAPQPVLSSAFAADGMHFAIGEVDGALRLMQGGGQTAGFQAPSGAVVSLDMLSDASRIAYATTTGHIGVLDGQGKPLWQAALGVRATIRFADKDGETIVIDWRGIVRRYDATGKVRWTTDLTPLVYREDTAAQLTTLDATPTLRLPAPDTKAATVPTNAQNLARAATVTFINPRDWWGGPQDPEPGAPNLVDGNTTPLQKPWFNRDVLDNICNVPSPPVWELNWKAPVTISVLAAYESPQHPEAVPEEVKIEAWVNDGWQEVAHDYWTHGVTHVHAFPAVTTTKLRYTPIGDLVENVWLSEVEVY